MSVQATEVQSIPTAPGAAALDASIENVTRLAEHGRRRLAVHVKRGTLGLTLLSIILGVYLAAQWQSKPKPTTAAPESRREIATATIQRLEAEQADLKKRIADLRAQVTQQQQLATSGTDLEQLTAELDAEKLIAGTVAVHGPGLKIVLDDSAVKTIPPKEDPSMYIVHEYQLRDVVNALWAAGAEAISINGERMVAPSSIYCVGSTILVNDTRTSPPYEFVVVGDPTKLDAAIGDPANLKALKSRVRAYGLQLSTQKQKDVAVPAYAGSLDVRHALTGSELIAAIRSGAQ